MQPQFYKISVQSYVYFNDSGKNIQQNFVKLGGIFSPESTRDVSLWCLDQF